MNCEIILQNYLKTKNIKFLNIFGYKIINNNIYFNNSILFQVYYRNCYYKNGIFRDKLVIIKIYEYNKLLSYINIKNNKIVYEKNIKLINTNFKNKQHIDLYFDICKFYINNSLFKINRKNFYNIFLIAAFNYYYSKNKYIIFSYKQFYFGVKNKYTYQYSNLLLFI